MPLNKETETESFTVCLSHRDFRSSILFLILWIWPCMDFSRSFWHVLVFSGLLKSFWVLEFVGILLSSKNAVFLFSRFLIACAFHGTPHLAFGLVTTHSTVTSVWMVTKFSNSSFGVYVSDVSCRVSDIFLISSIYCFLISL